MCNICVINVQNISNNKVIKLIYPIKLYHVMLMLQLKLRDFE